MVLAPTPSLKHPSQVIAKVGVIGCGNVSNIYMQNLQRATSLQVTAMSDINMARARAQAERYSTRALPVADLLASDVDIIVNLTAPWVHLSVSEQIIDAGKSLYSEYPLGLAYADMQRLLSRAAAKGVLVGCAPDTVLGAGLQTCRRIIDAGLIGEPLSASAFLFRTIAKHDTFQNDEQVDTACFYSQSDQSQSSQSQSSQSQSGQSQSGQQSRCAPYDILCCRGFNYLTALVHLLGSIQRVSGIARVARSKHKVRSAVARGEHVTVESTHKPTQIVGLLEFASGLRASLTTSFEMMALPASNPFGNLSSNIAIYGSDATLHVPDPNTFAGAVQLKTRYGDWQNIPLNAGYVDNSYGLGVADMAWALHDKRQQRVSGELTRHVLEATEKILLATQEQGWLTLQSHVVQPEPLTHSAETWFHLPS